MEWIKKNWPTATTIACFVIVGLIEAWDQATSGLPPTSHVPQLPGWGRFLPVILLIVAVAAWMIDRRRLKSSGQKLGTASQPPGITLGIPTLSGLLGQNPAVDFDPKKYFALAYYSPITAEMERNIKAIADKHYPNSREDFYVRFIGIGIVTVQHDFSWTLIYASQIDAMKDMNARGIIPIAEVKKHYDSAAAANPATYAAYSFDDWLSFLKGRMLIAVYPSGMVELSFNGKDFLRYLAHVGYDLSIKRN
ncbi:MAG TPA: hypothetical protein VHU89_17425 [Acidobacteriaceae bacterium]|jgi:hypothetical protein|nr:hypothetical protein [Acidobacteriaceae bacterium]